MSEKPNLLISQGHEMTKRYPNAPAIVCAVYVGLCWWLPKVLNGRKFNCHPILPLWNLLLSAFSFVGFLRTFPTLLHIILTSGSSSDPPVLMEYVPALGHMPTFAEGTVYKVLNGLENLFTGKASQNFGSGSCGLWVMLFIYSKFPELLDTFFLILRARPVIFLHWYHHITVLLFCLQSYRLESPAGLIFCVMNYGVHTVMYLYFFLTTLSLRPKAFRPYYVTVLQLSQMFLGIATCAYSALLYNSSSQLPTSEGSH